MTPQKKTKSKPLRKSNATRATRADISETQPVWYQPGAAQGSAVRYVASLSGRFNWVGIYVLKGKSLELGPFIGEPTARRKIAVGKGICGVAVTRNQDQNVPDVSARPEYLACSIATRSELVALVRDAKGKILGQIDIDSHTPAAFTPELENQVQKIAKELGERWHA